MSEPTDRPVCILPARGGSKRLPRKNILPLAGQPMLFWPVKAALDSGLFRAVVVSTDDPEIAEAAAEAGAIVADRPAHLATDTATMADVCRAFCDHPPPTIGAVDAMCCVLPTAVFLTPEDFHAAWAAFKKQRGAGVLMGVSRYREPPLRALRCDMNGQLSPMWPEWAAAKSQSFPELRVSNGTFYWCRPAALSQGRGFYAEPLYGFDLPPERALDIDTQDDYRAALAAAERLDRSAAVSGEGA